MKILGFLLKGRGGGEGVPYTLLSPRVLMEGLGMVCMYIVTWHQVTCLHSADRQDCLQNYLESESKLHKLNLLCFGSFAGAGAHHQGLRRLKPCQFQRTVYWHCECDKLCSNARFELLAVCCSWTRDRKAKWALSHQASICIFGSSIESWRCLDNFWCLRFKAGQRRSQKIANCLEEDFPAQRYAKFPRMQWGQIIAAWLFGWGCW